MGRVNHITRNLCKFLLDLFSVFDSFAIDFLNGISETLQIFGGGIIGGGFGSLVANVFDVASELVQTFAKCFLAFQQSLDLAAQLVQAFLGGSILGGPQVERGAEN